MRAPYNLVVLAAAGFLLSACAAGHALPEISAADSALAMQQIDAAPNLKTTARTTNENERIARRVVASLQGAAQPICAERDRNCWYTMEYSPKATFNAGILRNQIVMYDGLAQHLQTEDEFAAVLGHEIGHHIAGHYEKGKTNRAIGALLGGLIFAGVAAATGAYDNNSYAAQNDMGLAMDIGQQLGDISFSKEHEREADYIGAYLMTRAGYNPDAGGALWIKFSKASGEKKTGLLDSHPAGPDRLAAWKHTVEEVRYSTDLIPNLADAEEEPRLQQARAFNAPSGGTGGSGTGIALASLANSNDPPLSSILGATDKGLNIVGGAAKSTGYAPASGATWEGSGPVDGCGVAWHIAVRQLGSEIRGNLWWRSVKYDLYGDIDNWGRVRDAHAGKSADSRNAPGPRFFKLDFDLSQDAATGRYIIDSKSASCQTDFVLSRG